MSDQLTCPEAQAYLGLLLYGELSFDEEERVETHLLECGDCRAALERERALQAAFDSVAVEPPVSLLRECRSDLAARLKWERDAPAPHVSWYDRFLSMITGGSGLVLRPAGALALVALGFFGSRVTNVWPAAGSRGLSEAGMMRVSDVRSAGDGRVQVTVDETRQKIVSGSPDDQAIRQLLMQAVRDPNDPGLRADSIDLLNTRTRSAEIRDALVYALQHDENIGVRFKAMEGLKAFAQEPEVRSALSQTLLNDANAGIREQAIGLLEQGSGENLDRQIIGTLQQLMLREDNAGVRQKCQRVLASFNASPGIY